MKSDSYFLIEILSDHLAGWHTRRKPNVDWSLILKHAKSHEVEGIVYYQCKEYIPNELRSLLEKKYLASLYVYKNREALLEVVTKELERVNIPFIVVKGYEIAHLYPVPLLRTMGDCDIVIRRKDMQNAIKSVRNCGFSGSDIITTQQWEFKKNGIHFEFHDRLVQEGEYATRKQALFLNNYGQYIRGHSLDASFHFVFLLMHLRKHFLNRGVGIRQFMDLAVFIKNEPSLNWNWIEEKLNDLGLSKYARVCYGLVYKWFDVSVPVTYITLDERFYKQVTDLVMENGVFGFSDLSNRRIDAATSLVIEDGPIWVRRIVNVWKMSFLSYEIMRGYPGCTFVNDRPWLLPIAWIKRFIKLIFSNDKSRTKNSIQSVLTSEEELQERRELLDKMGLLK